MNTRSKTKTIQIPPPLQIVNNPPNVELPSEMYGVISQYINDPYSAYAYKQISKTHRKYSPKMKCTWDDISDKIIEQINDLYDLSRDYWNDSKRNINTYFKKYFFRVDNIYEFQMITPKIAYSVSRKDSQHILNNYEQEKENIWISGHITDRDRFNLRRLSKVTASLIYEELIKPHLPIPLRFVPITGVDINMNSDNIIKIIVDQKISPDALKEAFEKKWANNNNKDYELNQICNSIYILPSPPTDLRKN